MAHTCLIQTKSRWNRRSDERVDLWVLRNNHVPPYLYWGLEQLGDDEITRILDEAGALLLLADFPSTGRKIDRKAEAHLPMAIKFWFPNAYDEQLHQVLTSEIIFLLLSLLKATLEITLFFKIQAYYRGNVCPI